MNRRDSIRSLFLGSMAGGLALESCVTEPKQALEQKLWEYQYGRTPQEKAYDEKLLKNINFNKNVNFLVNKIQGNFLKKYKNEYNFVKIK